MRGETLRDVCAGGRGDDEVGRAVVEGDGFWFRGRRRKRWSHEGNVL